MKRRPIRTADIETPDGVFVASFSVRGLVAIDFPGRPSAGAQPAEADCDREMVDEPTLQQWEQLTQQALLTALRGQRPAEMPPLDWEDRTEFQRSVWTALLQIEPGETRSYGEIAVEIRNPKAVRAVGRACGANPIPVLVPCHRVTAAGGRIGGFPGGLDWKRKLLEREGRSALHFAADTQGRTSGQ